MLLFKTCMILDGIFSKTGVFVILFGDLFNWGRYIAPNNCTTGSPRIGVECISFSETDVPQPGSCSTPRKIISYFKTGQGSLNILDRNHFSVFHFKKNQLIHFFRRKRFVKTNIIREVIWAKSRCPQESSAESLTPIHQNVAV